MSAQIFRGVLVRERKRADRSGDAFLLLLVDLTQIDEVRRKTARNAAIDAVAAAKCETDVLGWFEDQSIIGLIVPQAGTASMARELEQQVGPIDTLLVATGGGGFTAGQAAWYRSRVKVVSVEPENSQCLRAALLAVAGFGVVTPLRAAEEIEIVRLIPPPPATLDGIVRPPPGGSFPPPTSSNSVTAVVRYRTDGKATHVEVFPHVSTGAAPRFQPVAPGGPVPACGRISGPSSGECAEAFAGSSSTARANALRAS